MARNRYQASMEGQIVYVANQFIRNFRRKLVFKRDYCLPDNSFIPPDRIDFDVPQISPPARRNIFDAGCANIFPFLAAFQTFFGKNEIYDSHVLQYQYMRIINKRARFEYELTPEKVEAGVSLLGVEAKSLREGRGDISQSFAKVIGNEIYLVNANIPAQGIQNYDSTRSRKLLLHRKEILSLLTKAKQQKLQFVPIVLYNKGRLIKLELCLGKPKRQFEKKEQIKRHDINREMERELKGSI